jgi:acylphosphatase
MDTIVDDAVHSAEVTRTSVSRMTGSGGISRRDCTTGDLDVMSSSSNHSERIVFSGRVQGVGFRYSTSSIAKRHPIVGYVRNLPDGTVETIVQGSTKAISDFLSEISSRFRHNLTGIDRSTVSAGEGFSTFEIRT